jgi:hypothetical protein
MYHSVLNAVTRPSGESSRIVQIERFMFMLDREICALYVDNKYPSAGRMISGGGPYCWVGDAPDCEYCPINQSWKMYNSYSLGVFYNGQLLTHLSNSWKRALRKMFLLQSLVNVRCANGGSSSFNSNFKLLTASVTFIGGEIRGSSEMTSQNNGNRP